jgi:3-hydroxyacyl-[acyl-carrier-protein] dehydratase
MTESLNRGPSEAAAGAMDIFKIMRLLPHRFPFLLVDRVDHVHRPAGAKNRVGVVIRATKNVTINEPFFPGHFPHRPVMPGVLLLEAMAQVAALACINADGPKMDVAIAGLDKCKFRRPVLPGDTLDISVEVLRDRGAMVVAYGETRVRGQVVCECELLAKMFSLIDTTVAASGAPGGRDAP